MRDDDKYPTIRVTNVSEDTTDEDLKQLFGRFGEWDPWYHQALWPHSQGPMLMLHHSSLFMFKNQRNVLVVSWFAITILAKTLDEQSKNILIHVIPVPVRSTDHQVAARWF